MPKQVILKIEGMVQGVLFRAETKKIADRLGITGYIKNEADGSVIVVAQGNETALRKLTIWCRKGPSRAQVKNIDLKIRPAKSLYEEFQIKY